MSNRILRLNDKILPQDSIVDRNLIKSIKHDSPFRRTKVICKNDLGEVLFEEENQIVLGGALFVLEKCWDVISPLTIESLNSIKGIGIDGPDVTKAAEHVCLFGVGTGGCGDGIGTVVDVKFYEREIFDMVPLRVTTPDQLTQDEAAQYWFKELLESGKTAYYLKTFESTPEIKVLWKDGEGDEDGSEVEPGVENTTRTEPIETFVEMILKITKKDVKEWFELNGDIELARFNSIGLFSGALGTLGDASQDYKNVRMFSKLNINNEMLTYAKDLTVIYRIYTS
jgi:hypothetical protein